MTILSPRMIRIAILSLALILLTSLPSFRVDRNPGSVLAPSIACAGGSPDETLKPPDSPPPPAQTPKKASALLRGGIRSVDTRTDLRLTALQRWRIFVSVFRTFATRF